ncbi:hypothetical protein ACS0TY_012263 [Phlomoides rotata]
MASIRRTLSPVPRPGALMNGEACQVASPLSKSSSNSQNYPPQGGLLGSLDYALYKARSFVLGLFSQRSSRPFDRSKLNVQFWRKAYLYFLMCFFVGMFVGLTPYFPLNLSINAMAKYQAFDYELLQPAAKDELYIVQKNEMPVVNRFSFKEKSILEPAKVNIELNNPPVEHTILNSSLDLVPDVAFHKLLIIVTPTYTRPFQAIYLNRLAQTLRLVPHPLLWIVVEMNSQSMEIAELLRNTGFMYRHLVGSAKGSTEISDRNALLRNVALSHIETHRLDGIVYFADDDKIYSSGLFDQMRNISRIGMWTVAKLVESTDKIFLEGPICNSSQVIGWHVADREKQSQRFHAELSGFAFNSTVIWDPKRWHRPTLEPIKQLATVREGMQASTFIEQVVEDESQMECFSMNSSGIMVWHHIVDTYSHPRNWFTSNTLGTIAEFV